MKFYSAKKVKQEDMVKVLVKEILDLNNELLYASEDNIYKLQRLQTRLSNNNTDNGFIMKFLKKNNKKIKRIKKRLSIFYKIFEIITEETEENEINNNKKAV
jgi:ribosomal protein S7